MRTFLMAFLVFSCYSIFARYYYVCKIKQNCSSLVANVNNEENDTRLKTLSLKYKETEKLKGYDQFYFQNGATSPNLNSNNKDFLEKIKVYLSNYPRQNLTITGLIRPDEITLDGGENSFQENIGVARAEMIERFLATIGVDETRIDLDYGVGAEELIEPILFDLYEGRSPRKYKKMQFSFYNMTFSDDNFEYNSAVFTPKEKLIAYADSVKVYLDLNPKKKLTIFGHTDNTGKEPFNDNLGLARAENAKKYFEKLGVTNDIEVGSRGEREPVVPNDSDENKKKNKRINFIIE